MKEVLWSLCVHMVVLGVLSYHHFAPGEAVKITAEPPILAYAYQPVKKPPNGPVDVPVVQSAQVEVIHKGIAVPKKPTGKSPVKTAQIKAKAPQKKPVSSKAKTTVVKTSTTSGQRQPFVPVRQPAMVKPVSITAKAKPTPVAQSVGVAAQKPLPAPAPLAANVSAVKALPAPVATSVKQMPTANTMASSPSSARPDLAALDQMANTANKTLQAVQAGNAAGSASWKEKQQQLALEITAASAEKKPEIGRKVKTFADGTALIDTNPGCWRVPAAQSRKDAMWLSTSVPCKADTRVEQIEAILQKRRSYDKN